MPPGAPLGLFLPAPVPSEYNVGSPCPRPQPIIPFSPAPPNERQAAYLDHPETSPVVTIFSISKPFRGHQDIIQRNAIDSWCRLQSDPAVEVILLGDDFGVAEAARDFSVKHIPSTATNEFGTPLLSAAFNAVQEQAEHDVLMYTNADIMFCQDIIDGLGAVTDPSFLLCGRRWDVNVTERVDFGDPDWVTALISKATLHGLGGSDYFGFRKGTVDMPPFLVGRGGWDNWLIYAIRMSGAPVIDATETITALHQNHDYSHSAEGGQHRVSGPELFYNIRVAGSFSKMFSLKHANWCLTPEGVKKPPFPRNLQSSLYATSLWRTMFAVTMHIYSSAPDFFDSRLGRAQG